MWHLAGNVGKKNDITLTFNFKLFIVYLGESGKNFKKLKDR